jgi:preprotein translocase subunit SecB
MAEEQNPQQADPQGAVPGAQFQIQKLYTKDVSFEIPNAPQVFQDAGQAEVKLNLSQRVQELDANNHEVVLTVTVTATVGEKTAYLAEVAQAGIFMVSGLNEQGMHAVINTLCPNTLFPYARSTISNLVADGGFPPLVLQPINFEQLYAQRMQQAAAEQDGPAGQADDETVQAEFKQND